MTRRRGSVLVLVVWVISLLSLLASSLGAQGLAALDMVSRMDERLQAANAAAAAVQYAVQVVRADASDATDGSLDEWARCESCFREQAAAGGRFTISYPTELEKVYGLIDEERKLSLNTMPAEVFAELLQREAQLRPTEAGDIGDAIVDWRDEDHEKRPHGAETFYYEGLSPSYPCKDAPFEQLEELLLVRGVTREVFDRIAPYVTPFGSGRLNLNTAERPALRTLGLSPDGVTQILRYRDGEDSRPGTGDERVFSSAESALMELGAVVSTDDYARLVELSGDDVFGVRSTAFTAAIEAWAADTAEQSTLSCVFDRDGSVLSWTEQ
jgi:general secretion pathway protein K